MDDLIEKKRLITMKLDAFLKELNRRNSTESVLSVLIFTNFGHIECSLIESEGSDQDPVGIIFSGAVDLANIQEVSALHLKSAKITPYGHKEPAHIVEDMILFTDQIIGLSFT